MKVEGKKKLNKGKISNLHRKQKIRIKKIASDK